MSVEDAIDDLIDDRLRDKGLDDLPDFDDFMTESAVDDMISEAIREHENDSDSIDNEIEHWVTSALANMPDARESRCTAGDAFTSAVMKVLADIEVREVIMAHVRYVEPTEETNLGSMMEAMVTTAPDPVPAVELHPVGTASPISLEEIDKFKADLIAACNGNRWFGPTVGHAMQEMFRAVESTRRAVMAQETTAV